MERDNVNQTRRTRHGFLPSNTLHQTLLSVTSHIRIAPQPPVKHHGPVNSNLFDSLSVVPGTHSEAHASYPGIFHLLRLHFTRQVSRFSNSQMYQTRMIPLILTWRLGEFV